MVRTVVATALFLVIACNHPARAPLPAAPPSTPTPLPAMIGETWIVPSKILGEDRVVNVYLPPGYNRTSTKYPVMYMPDGGLDEDFPHVTGAVDVSIKNAVIRPIIVVGVANTERRRDLAGPTTVAEEQELAPHAGGSAKFRRFLGDELKPHIAAHYRVSGESAIIGESLAGLFVIETLIVEPGLFDAYIAADPSVWWNQGVVVRSASERFARWTESPKQLFVATADHKEMQDGVAMLMAAIRERAPAGLVAHHAPMPDEHHNTIFPFAALRGIRTVFAAPAPVTP